MLVIGKFKVVRFRNCQTLQKVALRGSEGVPLLLIHGNHTGNISEKTITRTSQNVSMSKAFELASSSRNLVYRKPLVCAQRWSLELFGFGLVEKWAAF